MEKKEIDKEIKEEKKRGSLNIQRESDDGEERERKEGTIKRKRKIGTYGNNINFKIE